MKCREYLDVKQRKKHQDGEDYIMRSFIISTVH
jgi:hypothetical protein